MNRGPFYTIKQAAEYCGYACPDHFGKMLREYQVPRRGPKQNRFARADLDRFMENPRVFLLPRRTGKTSYQLQWQ